MKRTWLIITAVLLVFALAGWLGYWWIGSSTVSPSKPEQPPYAVAGPDNAGEESPALLPGTEQEQPAVQGSDLNHDDFTLAGFRPFDQRTEVEKVLGPPEKVETTNNGWLLETLYYQEASMTFYLGGAVSITVTGPKFTTARGIRVGDPVEKVLQVYGSNYTQWTGGPDGTITYNRDENSAISFEVSHNQVASITSATYPGD